MKRLLLFTATALVLAAPVSFARVQDDGQYPQDDGPNAQDDGQYAQDDGQYAQDDGQYAQDDGQYAQGDGQSGYTTGDVNLRAGPDIDYPSVSVIPEGTELQIQGCTQGWEWCDVIVGDSDDRGWVAGNYIEYDYQDRPVLVSEYGARVGVPLVTFSISNYWDRYYRYRPFYGDRVRWYRRPYYHHPAPRPFVGWSLRFGINGRDHHDWNHHDRHDWHNNWDRNHYYNHGHDQNHSDHGNDHGHDHGNDHGGDHRHDHGQVVPVQHSNPGGNDHGHGHDSQDHHAPQAPQMNQGGGNHPQPVHVNAQPVPNAPPKDNHQAHDNHQNKPADQPKKKDDKGDDKHH